MAQTKGSGLFDRHEHFTAVFFQPNLIHVPRHTLDGPGQHIVDASGTLHAVDNCVANLESRFHVNHLCSPATVSAEGRLSGPFPATAWAEGRQFNGGPSSATVVATTALRPGAVPAAPRSRLAHEHSRSGTVCCYTRRDGSRVNIPPPLHKTCQPCRRAAPPQSRVDTRPHPW